MTWRGGSSPNADLQVNQLVRAREADPDFVEFHGRVVAQFRSLVTDRSQSCLNAIEFALTQACPDLAYDSCTSHLN